MSPRAPSEAPPLAPSAPPGASVPSASSQQSFAATPSDSEFPDELPDFAELADSSESAADGFAVGADEVSLALPSESELSLSLPEEEESFGAPAQDVGSETPEEESLGLDLPSEADFEAAYDADPDDDDSLDLEPPLDAFAPEAEEGDFPLGLPEEAEEEEPAPAETTAQASVALAPGEADDGSPRCVVHGLRAIGSCHRCAASVCSVCSLKWGKDQRTCLACAEAASVPQPTQFMAALLQALPAAWTLFAALGPLGYVVFFLAPPDEALVIPTWLPIMAVVGFLHAILTAFALSKVLPDWYRATLALNAIGLLSFPLGTALSAVGLFTLIHPEIRPLYDSELFALRARSKAVVLVIPIWARVVFGVLLGSMLTAAGIAAIRIKLEHDRTVTASRAPTLKFPRYGQWKFGQTFQINSYHQRLLQLPKNVEQRRSFLQATGEVLGLSKDATPSRVSLKIRKIASIQTNRTVQCEEIEVIVTFPPTGPAAVEKWDKRCTEGMAAELPALLPQWRSGAADIDGTFSLGDGGVWTASGKELRAWMRLFDAPFAPTNDIDATVEILDRHTCGWNQCLVAKSTTRGKLAYAPFREFVVRGGQFAEEMTIRTPDRLGSCSFLHDGRTETQLEIAEIDGVAALLSTNVSRFEVMADGEHAQFKLNQEDYCREMDCEGSMGPVFSMEHRLLSSLDAVAGSEDLHCGHGAAPACFVRLATATSDPTPCKEIEDVPARDNCLATVALTMEDGKSACKLIRDGARKAACVQAAERRTKVLEASKASEEPKAAEQSPTE